MVKWHLNPDRGVVTRCRATTGKCRYGGETGSENHFENIDDAKQAFEKTMQDDTIPSMSKSTESPELSSIRVEYQKILDTWNDLHKKIKDRVLEDPDFELTDEWYSKVQEKKKVFYEVIKIERARNDLLPPEELAAEQAKYVGRKEKDPESYQKWKAANPNAAHPGITKRNAPRVQELIYTFSGVPKEEVESRANEYIEQGSTIDEAYKQVWSEVSLRKDKPIVAIDLEVAAPTMRGGRVDNGPYSSIIEVGYAKIDPDGSVKETQYISGVPDDLLATSGTGAEHIHGITTDMVDGQVPFVEDRERQEQLLNDLKGSVLLAHNAGFETSQFKHNLPGFSEALRKGEIEILDTMQISKFFCPENETNTNKDFVEGTGGKYEGAHRALEDAKMSVNALFTLKKVDITV